MLLRPLLHSQCSENPRESGVLLRVCADRSCDFPLNTCEDSETHLPPLAQTLANLSGLAMTSGPGLNCAVLAETFFGLWAKADKPGQFSAPYSIVNEPAVTEACVIAISLSTGGIAQSVHLARIYLERGLEVVE